MPNVFLTGASRGLGLEFAKQYAAEGWRVIATVRDPARADALRAIKGKVEIHALDVMDFAAAARLGDVLRDEAIDVLIANAGISGPRDMSLKHIDGDAWAEVFRVNTMAPAAIAGALTDQIARSGQRKAIAISSRLGSMAENNDGGMYVYRSSKAALNAVWRSFAIDNPGLIATVLHPGWVRTDMGGEAAPIAPSESVAGMRRVIDGLTKQDSGGFRNFDGPPLPW
jgi:NAD(P)-dependent dehydrogenase (short-subunit alcohol dehydrogenase family)